MNRFSTLSPLAAIAMIAAVGMPPDVEEDRYRAGRRDPPAPRRGFSCGALVAPRPKPDADLERIAAAQEKRERKRAARLAAKTS